MLRSALVFALITTAASVAQQIVHGTEATSGERFRTAEGMTVAIEGIQAPEIEDDGTVVSFGGPKARSTLDGLIRGQTVTLEIERDRRLPEGEVLAHVRRDDGKLLSEILLEAGAVRLCLEEDALRHAAKLREAQANAKAARIGVWSRLP